MHGIFFLIYLTCTALLCPGLTLLLTSAVLIFLAFKGLFSRKKNVTVEFRAPKLGKSALFWSKKVTSGAQVPMIWQRKNRDFERWFSSPSPHARSLHRDHPMRGTGLIRPWGQIRRDFGRFSADALLTPWIIKAIRWAFLAQEPMTQML